jgi:hypothetical protein
MATPDAQNDTTSLSCGSFRFVPTDMSAARAEWNRLANNMPALEERSSDKGKCLAPSDGVSVVPLASTSSRSGTGVGEEPERSSVKTTPQRGIVRETTSITDTTTRRTKPSEEWTTHPEMVTRTVIGPPEFFYSKDNSFYHSETRYDHHEPFVSVTDWGHSVLPKFWTKHVHFSGKVYFHHRRFNLITPNDIREPLILQNIERIRKQEISKFIKVVNPKDLPSCEHIVTLPRLDSSDAADIYHAAIDSRRVLRMDGDNGMESMTTAWI